MDEAQEIFSSISGISGHQFFQWFSWSDSPVNQRGWGGQVPLDRAALSVKLFVMQTNVSTLLREFPKVKRAALRGERVVIKTREGNLVLAAESPPERHLLGSMRGTFSETGGDLSTPTLPETDWKPSL